MSAPHRCRQFPGITSLLCLVCWTVSADAQQPPEPVKNWIGMELVLIPAGEFVMGNPDYRTEEGKGHEGPTHRVRFSKPFLLGCHEVTQAQYETIMERNPSYFSSTGEGKDQMAGTDTSNFPVERVSWYDAAIFCNALSEYEGLPPYYELRNERDEESNFLGKLTIYKRYDVSVAGGPGYRLPTEAEWEYACRAGTQTPFHFGSVGDGTLANTNGRYPYGTMFRGPEREQTLPVGSFAPNRWGLYDMHGNVAELCFDEYDREVYASRRGVTVDPVVARKLIPGDGKATHAVRGGSWQISGLSSTSHYRNSTSAAYFNHRDTGFRVARTPD